jgi:hypothetical protein
MGLAATVGCASESLKPNGDGSVPITMTGNDGGAPDRLADPAACGCQLNGYTLTISWDCYCKQYKCTGMMQPSCPLTGQWERGCNYQKYSVFTIGGVESWVYDEAGQMVGAQLGTDDGIFSCPTDPSMQGFVLRAGYLLEDCEAISTSGYDADAGVCGPTDAGLVLQ